MSLPLGAGRPAGVRRRHPVAVMRPLLAAAALACPAAGAAEPSFDCSDPATSAQEAVCTDEGLAALDVELARLYRAAATGSNMTDERLSELRATQRRWINGRDECWKASMGLRSCIRASYATRIHELRQGYGDARAEPGPSTGPFPWLCDGLDSVVSTAFVNRPEPVASLRWRDNAVVLPQVRSASGAKYESDEWEGGTATFWTRGGEAMFTPPGGSAHACRLDAMN